MEILNWKTLWCHHGVGFFWLILPLINLVYFLIMILLTSRTTLTLLGEGFVILHRRGRFHVLYIQYITKFFCCVFSFLGWLGGRDILMISVISDFI